MRRRRKGAAALVEAVLSAWLQTPLAGPTALVARVNAQVGRQDRTALTSSARGRSAPAGPVCRPDGGRWRRARGRIKSPTGEPSGWSACPLTMPPAAAGGAQRGSGEDARRSRRAGGMGHAGAAAAAGRCRPGLAAPAPVPGLWVRAGSRSGPLGGRASDDHLAWGEGTGVGRVAPHLPVVGGAGLGPQGRCGGAGAQEPRALARVVCGLRCAHRRRC